MTGPTPPGRALVIKAVKVLTITKNAAPSLLSGGSVSTDGFVNVLFSLARMQRGASTKAEKVGGVLLPEEELPPESLGGARSITLCAGYPCSISNWFTPLLRSHCEPSSFSPAIGCSFTTTQIGPWCLPFTCTFLDEIPISPRVTQDSLD